MHSFDDPVLYELLEHAQWLQRRPCSDPGTAAWNRVKLKQLVAMARARLRVLRRK